MQLATGVNPRFVVHDYKVESINQDLDKLREMMVFNIEYMVKNEIKLTELEQKTLDLSHNAKDFKDKAGTLKRQMWWQKYKIPLIATGSTAGVASALLFLL
jgi:hypothetical protein